jgi:cell wall-associated NlpC family hydrolase
MARRRIRRRLSRRDRRFTASAVAVGIALAVISGHGAAGAAGSRTASAAPASGAAAQAIAFAEQRAAWQCPYVYAATGPCSSGYDCSGLVMEAYASAGVSIERTSQDQWATLPHVDPSHVQPGDLVFFAGSDGTLTSPGHVGIVINPAKDEMVDAYATRFNVEYDTYGPGESKEGLDPVVGFAQPWGGA